MKGFTERNDMEQADKLLCFMHCLLWIATIFCSVIKFSHSNLRQEAIVNADTSNLAIYLELST